MRILLLIIAGVMCFASAGACAAAPPTDAEAMLAESNRIRAEYRLPAQALDPQLTEAAQGYAEYLARSGGFGHYADGRSPGQRIAATGLSVSTWRENMAGGQRDVREAFVAWRNSGGHRANMLSGTTHAGFGHAGRYWVAVYATPSK